MQLFNSEGEYPLFCIKPCGPFFGLLWPPPPSLTVLPNRLDFNKVDISWTSIPPMAVHMVCVCPLNPTRKRCNSKLHFSGLQRAFFLFFYFFLAFTIYVILKPIVWKIPRVYYYTHSSHFSLHEKRAGGNKELGRYIFSVQYIISFF